MTAEISIILCGTCPLGRSDFRSRLADTLSADDPLLRISTVECMSGCARPSTLAVRAPGKTAYLFGDLTEADLPLIRNFLALYRCSDDGNFPDARVLGDLRFKAVARIPG
ncbi:hypothetical protein DDZ14_07850 [Maritimibacter sp. 55A14]|uniref:DUF1636 family protein n=1 Tax=Maritimibacter sp. 55A14 TaxID=2174844 RepID=UPI000D61A438|nr:DUF1636 family protein [Maritimibacter sp. 55A14]PWE32993.1 hypothetical protein DDZ14_07850 [Maritimibacter sp. 55A14]